MADSLPLSLSQFKSYSPEHGGCPHAWWLKKVKRVRQTPAAWLPQGTGWHAAVEHWEKSDRTATLAECEEVYGRVYDEEVCRLCEETPDLNDWFDSGFRYPAELDIPRRYDKGMDQVKTWMAYYGPRDKPLTMPDGSVGVEVPVDVQLDGDVQLRGYVDAVFPGTVVDGKTGNNPPKNADGQEDPTQLGVYKVTLEKAHGVTVDQGHYFMANTGKPSREHDLKGWTLDRVTDMFGGLADNIRAERFDPAPEPDKCRMCSVQQFCRVVNPDADI